jgi:hypothetical protein
MVGLYLFFVYATCCGSNRANLRSRFSPSAREPICFRTGGLSGQFALVNLSLWRISQWGIRIDYRNEGLFVDPVAVVRATLGAAG